MSRRGDLSIRTTKENVMNFNSKSHVYNLNMLLANADIEVSLESKLMKSYVICKGLLQLQIIKI